MAIVFSIVVIIIVAEKQGLLNFFQVFVTSKPGDVEIQLAIEGLKQFEELEKKLERGESISFTMDLPENMIPTIVIQKRE